MPPDGPILRRHLALDNLLDARRRKLEKQVSLLPDRIQTAEILTAVRAGDEQKTTGRGRG